MYLVQARRLRQKLNPFGGVRLLSLERLETMNRRAINWAFPLLTAGLLVGAIRLPTADTSAVSWTDLKILSTVGPVGRLPGAAVPALRGPPAGRGGWPC